MEQKVLTAVTREGQGKGAARKLRASGKIPAVMYGHDAPVAIHIDEREFSKAFHTVSESTLISLTVGKKKHDVLVKDYQEDIMTGRVMHIDFYEVEQGKLLRTHVPIILHGSPVGVREGGILEHGMQEVEVECVPVDIPETIEISVAELAIGESLHVSDIPAPEGVKILNSPEQMIASVVMPRHEAEPTEEAEAEEEAAEEALREESEEPEEE